MQTTLMLGLALAIAAPAPKGPPKKELPSLVGEWVLELAVTDGIAEAVSDGSLVAFTSGGRCVLKEPTQEPVEMTFTVDANKALAEIDIPEPGDTTGTKVMKGIYKFDGDSLVICLAVTGERPKMFASPPDSDTILVTLKRLK